VKCFSVREFHGTLWGEMTTLPGRTAIIIGTSSAIPDILGRRALPAGRIPGLGATPDFHHGLLAQL
jgi:hypothetical protein